MVEKQLDKEYLPISGLADFTKESINLALGEGNRWTGNGLVMNISDEVLRLANNSI